MVFLVFLLPPTATLCGAQNVSSNPFSFFFFHCMLDVRSICCGVYWCVHVQYVLFNYENRKIALHVYMTTTNSNKKTTTTTTSTNKEQKQTRRLLRYAKLVLKYKATDHMCIQTLRGPVNCSTLMCIYSVIFGTTMWNFKKPYKKYVMYTLKAKVQWIFSWDSQSLLKLALKFRKIVLNHIIPFAKVHFRSLLSSWKEKLIKSKITMARTIHRKVRMYWHFT